MLFKRVITLSFAVLTLTLYAETINVDRPNYTKTINENRSNQWMKSLEYNLLCQQIFQNAKNRIEMLDLDNPLSVVLESQTKPNLPLAVITDIDETILLNYDFQIETRKRGGKFSYELFEKFVTKKTAIPISGSIEYYKYLNSKGIKIIYISNRHISSEEKTFEYLKELGYPIKDKNDILLKDEIPEWTSDKSSRRLYVGNRYRVIQMFGDHLKDFTETEESAIQNKDKFGVSWFIIPNATYGTWLN